MAIASLSPTKGTKGPTCAVCKTLKRLDPPEAEALRDHMRNPEWRFSELSDALFDDEKVDLPAQSLARHARGQCAARERLR